MRRLVFEEQFASSSPPQQQIKREDLLTKTDAELCAEHGHLSFAQVSQQRQALLRSAFKTHISTLSSYQHSSSFVQTGFPALDSNQAVRKHNLLCLRGARAAGKTQFCMQLAVNSCTYLLHTEQRVLFIDTSNTLSLQRVGDMFAAASRTTAAASAAAMRRLDIARAPQIDLLLRQLDGLLEEDSVVTGYDLVIIDSLSVIVDTLLLPGSNKSSGGRNWGLVGLLASLLRRLAERTALVVSVTDHTTNTTMGQFNWYHYLGAQQLCIERVPGDGNGRFAQCRLTPPAIHFDLNARELCLDL